MNKEGSYIVEASITMPILIISICSLILIIRIVMVCESITFSTSKYLIDSIFGYGIGFIENPLCKEIEEISSDITSFKVTKYRYLYDEGEMMDLIALDAEAKFNIVNAIGINGNICFDEKVLCRGFTGNFQSGTPLEEMEFSRYKNSFKVYVFPKYGKKYHLKNCRYITSKREDIVYIKEMDREDAMRRGYMPCIVCKGAAYEQ